MQTALLTKQITSKCRLPDTNETCFAISSITSFTWSQATLTRKVDSGPQVLTFHAQWRALCSIYRHYGISLSHTNYCCIINTTQLVIRQTNVAAFQPMQVRSCYVRPSCMWSASYHNADCWLTQNPRTVLLSKKLVINQSIEKHCNFSIHENLSLLFCDIHNSEMIDHHWHTVLANSTLRQAIVASQSQVLPLTWVTYKCNTMTNNAKTIQKWLHIIACK